MYVKLHVYSPRPTHTQTLYEHFLCIKKEYFMFRGEFYLQYAATVLIFVLFLFQISKAQFQIVGNYFRDPTKNLEYMYIIIMPMDKSLFLLDGDTIFQAVFSVFKSISRIN